MADNRTAELAEWDEAALVQLLQSLDGDIVHVGFDQRELEQLIRDISPPKEETFNVGEALRSAPELAERVKPGQVWQLGRHRLKCGDATNAQDMHLLMGGARATMAFTDPPWNVGIGQDSNPRHRQRPGLINDNLSDDDYQHLLDVAAANLAQRITGDLYCILGSEQWPRLDAALRRAGFHWSATIIWVKDIFVLGRSKYHRRYEPIWYGWPLVSTSSYSAGRDEDDVWEIPRPRVSEEHPTMKPVELVERAIGNSSQVGDCVVDPFLGSGTTMIAADRMGRVCCGMDIDPLYFAVAIARWESYSGESAVLLDG